MCLNWVSYLGSVRRWSLVKAYKGNSIISYSHHNFQIAPEFRDFELHLSYMTFFFPPRKRLDYVNHARRLAEDDWTGMESEEEEEKKDDEKMEVDTGKKLPKRYANQVSGPEKIRCSWSCSIYCAIRALYLTMNREEETGRIGTALKVLMCRTFLRWRDGLQLCVLMGVADGVWIVGFRIITPCC